MSDENTGPNAAPIRLGVFDLIEPLGHGGMGEVWRGRHRHQQVPAAVKLIKGPGGLEERLRFEHEVQSHAALDHPGIVYLFDYGTVSVGEAAGSRGKLLPGSPYLVMELAEHGSVRELLPIDSWASAYAILRSVLDALAHAHARGVIHRDLKPGNILIFGDTERVRIKLADFGLAHALSDEHARPLDELSQPSGTPAFMAPEQVLGKWRTFGPWTDLYAVGCIAYELVCGRPPFSGRNRVRLAFKHVNDARPEVAPTFSVPHGVEAWIRRAMSIPIDARFRHAAEALAALPEPDEPMSWKLAADVEFAGSAKLEFETRPLMHTLQAWREWGSHDAPTVREVVRNSSAGFIETPVAGPAIAAVGRQPPAPEPVALPRLDVPASWRRERAHRRPDLLVGAGLGLFGLRELPYVDREAARDALWAALRRVADDGGTRVLFISGAPGAGASSLVDWVATRASEVGAAQKFAVLHSAGAGAELDGIPGLVRRAFRTWKLGRAQLHEHLLEMLPSWGEGDTVREHDARALTELLEPTADDADTVDGPPYRFRSAMQRHALIQRLFRRLTVHRPALVILDDLQWGRATVDALEFMLESTEPPANALFVATLRADELAENPVLAARLRTFARLDVCAWLELDRLGAEDHRELVAKALPLEPSLADQIARRTEGNPMFAVQLLGHLIERRQLRMGPSGFCLDVALDEVMPDDVFALWSGRFDRLVASWRPDERAGVRRAIELAAVLGRHVRDEEWAAVCAGAGLELPERLVERLVSRGLATHMNDGWAFAYGLLVDSILRQADQAGRLQAHHRLCARSLAQLQDDGGRRTWLRQADHWEKAGEAERALAPLLGAYERAVQGGDLAARREILERRARLIDQLALPADDLRRLVNDARLSDVLLTSGQVDQAQARALATRELAARDGRGAVLANVLVVLSLCAQRQGAMDEAIDRASQAVDVARQHGDDYWLAKAYEQVAWSQLFAGNAAEAEAGFGHMRATAQAAGRRWLALLACYGLSAVAIEHGAYEEAARYARELLEPARQQGYRWLEAQAHNILGEAARFGGFEAEALRHYRDYERLARSLGRQMNVATASLNQAMVQVSLGQFGDAGACLARAAALFAALGVQNRAGFADMVRLAAAAGCGDHATFDSLIDTFFPSPETDAWPDGQRFARDVPLLAETAARHAHQHGDAARAQRALRLARAQYLRLGDAPAAERVGAQLATTNTTPPE